MSDADARTATLVAAQERGGPEIDLGHLFVLIGDSTALHRLGRGELVIGRAEDAGLVLDDPSISRRHARIAIEGRAAFLEDLGSHNGTFANGVRLAAARRLEAGDVITIGAATLVFHGRGGAPPAARRALIAWEELERRLAEEVERTVRSGRPATLVVVELGSAAEALAGPVERALAEVLGRIDVAACIDERVVALLPDTDAEEAEDSARELGAAVRTVAPRARAGYAVCPDDGCQADVLQAAAVAAARAAAPGAVEPAARTGQTIRVGDRTIVVADPAMQRLYALIERLALADLPVLITGETGAGKELAAAALHAGSPRRARRLVAINCAALPEALVESELFGYEKGAFSGAAAAKAGLFESAAGGTLFLDEIGELSLATQSKLLRALETRRITRLGALDERAVDVRLVAATNRNLEADVAAGRFRRDLYFRIAAATLCLPALRDRRRELPLLVRAFLEEACAHLGRAPLALSAAALDRLARHHWPGNVRELRNVIDFLAATVVGARADVEDLPAYLLAGGGAPPASGPARSLPDELRDLERARIVEALATTAGHQRRAADLLGMPLRTLCSRIKHYGLGARR